MEHSQKNVRSEEQRQQGFTLLEVIMAISILTIGLLAVATMQGSAMRANAVATDLTNAATIAADRMEKLAALGYGDVNLEDRDGDGASGLEDTGFDNNPLTTADADYRTNRHTATGKAYAVYWNVAIDDATAGTKTINIIVAWDERGREKKVSLRLIKPQL
jgi:prepilin-type N-terminal cleavage/methylation domain-containing protein